ncbi:hypothetical protein AALA13_00060 [Lachnospiraceae bacterium 50-23]
MRIYSSQNVNLGYAGIGNQNFNGGNHTQGANNGARNDQAVISPQGKSSSMLNMLMQQKELIQESKNAVIKDAMEKMENGYSVNIQEKLEEYEEQLDAVDEQIAKEMARQMEEDVEKTGENTYENPRKVTEQQAQNEKMAKVAALSGSVEQLETMDSVKDRVDGTIRSLKAEIKSDGGRTTDGKRKLVAELESRSEDLAGKIYEKAGAIQVSAEKPSDIRNTEIVEEKEENELPGRLPEEETQE